MYYCFVKETAPKCGCLIDFFVNSLPTMHAGTHAHPCSLQLFDRSLYIEKISTIYSSQKKHSTFGGFCAFSAILWVFKSLCLALWLYNILVINDVANCGRLRDSLGHREHIYLCIVSKYFTVSLINKTKFSNPCLALKSSIAVKGIIFFVI